MLRTRYRVVKLAGYRGVYELQVWRWWRPFWKHVDVGNVDEMREKAYALLLPTIEYIGIDAARAATTTEG